MIQFPVLPLTQVEDSVSKLHADGNAVERSQLDAAQRNTEDILSACSCNTRSSKCRPDREAWPPWRGSTASVTKEEAAATREPSLTNTRQPPPRRTTREFTHPHIPSSRVQSVKRNFVSRIVIAHRWDVIIGRGGCYTPENTKIDEKRNKKRQFSSPLRNIDGSVTR